MAITISKYGSYNASSTDHFYDFSFVFGALFVICDKKKNCVTAQMLINFHYMKKSGQNII